MIRKNHNILLLLAAWTALFTACGNDDDTSPFDGREPVLSENVLPQGNHDYDQTILEWHRRFGTLPLYRFDEKDWYWGVTSDIRIYYDEKADKDYGGYLVVPADERYVGQQLQLIEDQVLKYLPDEFLRQMLPMKLLLASDIQHDPAAMKGKVPESQYTHPNTLAGYDYVAFSGGSAHVAEMTQAEQAAYKGDGIMLVMGYAIDNGKIGVPQDFAALSDYAANFATAAAAYANGLLSQYGSSPTHDLKQYIKLMTTTSSERIEAQYLNSYPLIKQKYEIVEDYFKKQYDIDLQAIGNGH